MLSIFEQKSPKRRPLQFGQAAPRPEVSNDERDDDSIAWDWDWLPGAPFLLRIAQRRRLIAASTILGGVLGVSVWMSTPAQYTAYADIMLNAPPTDHVSGDGQAASRTAAETKAIIDRHRTTILSGDVLEPVIARFGLMDDPEFNGSATGFAGLAFGSGATASAERTRENLRASVVARPTKHSHVMRVAVKASASKKAAELANGIAESFIAHQDGRATLAQDDTATAALHAAADEARSRLAAFRASHGLSGVNVDAQSLPLTGLGAARIALAEARQQATHARTTVETGQGDGIDQITTASIPEQNPAKLATRQTVLRRAIAAEQAATQEIARIRSRLALGVPVADTLAELERDVVLAQAAVETATADLNNHPDKPSQRPAATVFAEALPPARASKPVGSMGVFAGLFAGFAVGAAAAMTGRREKPHRKSRFAPSSSSQAEPVAPAQTKVPQTKAPATTTAPTTRRNTVVRRAAMPQHDTASEPLTFKPKARRGPRTTARTEANTAPLQNRSRPVQGSVYPSPIPMRAPMPMPAPMPMHAPVPMVMPMPATQWGYPHVVAYAPMHPHFFGPPVINHNQAVQAPTCPAYHVMPQHHWQNLTTSADRSFAPHDGPSHFDNSLDEPDMEELRQTVHDIRAAINALSDRDPY